MLFGVAVTHVVVDVKDFVDRTDVVEKAIAAKIPVVSTKYVHRCVAEEQVLNPTGKYVNITPTLSMASNSPPCHTDFTTRMVCFWRRSFLRK